MRKNRNSASYQEEMSDAWDRIERFVDLQDIENESDFKARIERVPRTSPGFANALWNNAPQARIFKTDRELHTQAGGSNLKLDRQRTAKTVVTNVREYKERGANRVDLKGYDTRRVKYHQIIGNKRSQTIKIRNKSRVIWRDNKGRFTKIPRV